MRVNIKLKTSYFLIAVVLALFTSIYHFNHTKPPLIYDNTQINIILLHESESIQNYISSEIGNNNNNQIIVWKDLLPTTFIPNDNFNLKLFKLENIRYFFHNIRNYSILNRYSTRVLRL